MFQCMYTRMYIHEHICRHKQYTRMAEIASVCSPFSQLLCHLCLRPALTQSVLSSQPSPSEETSQQAGHSRIAEHHDNKFYVGRLLFLPVLGKPHCYWEEIITLFYQNPILMDRNTFLYRTHIHLKYFQIQDYISNDSKPLRNIKKIILWFCSWWWSLRHVSGWP